MEVSYIGQGDFIQGLPARDMSLEEWTSYPEDLLAAALAAGLYIVDTENQDELHNSA